VCVCVRMQGAHKRLTPYCGDEVLPLPVRYSSMLSACRHRHLPPPPLFFPRFFFLRVFPSIYIVSFLAKPCHGATSHPLLAHSRCGSRPLTLLQAMRLKLCASHLAGYAPQAMRLASSKAAIRIASGYAPLICASMAGYAPQAMRLRLCASHQRLYCRLCSSGYAPLSCASHLRLYGRLCSSGYAPQAMRLSSALLLQAMRLRPRSSGYAPQAMRLASSKAAMRIASGYAPLICASMAGYAPQAMRLRLCASHLRLYCRL
jgi:hypothetical protein